MSSNKSVNKRQRLSIKRNTDRTTYEYILRSARIDNSVLRLVTHLQAVYGTIFLIGSQFFIAHLQTLLETTSLPPVLTVNHVVPPNTPPPPSSQTLTMVHFSPKSISRDLGRMHYNFDPSLFTGYFFIVRWYRDQFSASKKLDGSVVEKKKKGKHRKLLLIKQKTCCEMSVLCAPMMSSVYNFWVSSFREIFPHFTDLYLTLPWDGS